MSDFIQLDKNVWPSAEATNLNRRSSSEIEQPCKYLLARRKLGDGTFSTVFECKDKLTGRHYAAKVYKKSLVYGLESMLQNEFLVLKKVSLNHDNILRIVDYFETPRELFLVTEVAYGGDLFDRIVSSRKLEENQVVEITRTLMRAIAYLHTNSIVHRDLKAENILFHTKREEDLRILVADFGLARILQYGEKITENCGTLSYVAPEVLKGVGHDFAVDIWSMGVLVYFMLCGYMPFDCETDEETRSAILAGDYRYEPPEYWLHVSADAKDFVDRCLVVDPVNRITALSATTHPFLLQGNKIKSMPDKTSSSKDIHDNLKAALMQLHLPGEGPKGSIPVHRSTGTSHTISTVSSRLSLAGSGRRDPLNDYSTLDGAYCKSPERVSKFSTPVVSNTVSRLQSYSSMLELLNDSTSDVNSPKFFV